MAQKRAEKQRITEQQVCDDAECLFCAFSRRFDMWPQAEEARLQLEEKLERCIRLKRMDDYQRQQQGIRVEQEKLRCSDEQQQQQQQQQRQQQQRR